MHSKIESALVKHAVLLGWFVVDVNIEDGMIMVQCHDGSEDKLECGITWMEHGPHEVWIQRKGGHYVPYSIVL